jgi:hypothetical protein
MYVLHTVNSDRQHNCWMSSDRLQCAGGRDKGEIVSGLALGLTQRRVQLMMLFSLWVKGLSLEETYSAV